MRMDQTQPTTARDMVNGLDEAELIRIFTRYGEEKFSKSIARRIVHRRAVAPIETTGELAELIKEAIPAPARRTGPHPARRVFQALRIAVNDELGALEEALDGAFEVLKPGAPGGHHLSLSRGPNCEASVSAMGPGLHVSAGLSSLSVRKRTAGDHCHSETHRSLRSGGNRKSTEQVCETACGGKTITACHARMQGS
ncbi:hypothetical protein GCM10025857_05360 [Alicyclobacillus contaminans]|nr:hypothetical protein GCM10025857_05360 [Alicyclobacillus contaminans]